MGIQEFLATHPVFTHQELVESLNGGKARSAKTLESLLAYHRRQGRVLRVRRGLYCAVPPGMEPATCPLDAWLVASKLADDAVLAYHTALEFHGLAYSVFYEIQYLTQQAVRPLSFRSCRFRRVKFPCQLVNSGNQNLSVVNEEHAGMPVAVTSLERTLVDVLDRPDLGGGWEEIWRSLAMAPFFDLDKVVEYTLLLNNATTAAKVGFCLEQHQQALGVEPAHLQALHAHRPRQPHYLSRHQEGRLVPPWNLVVPTELLDRTWEAVL